jgi:hypothetical protein
VELWVKSSSRRSRLFRISQTARCRSRRRLHSFAPVIFSTDLDRRGLSPDQYDSVLDDEGLALKAQLKQLHRWSWPLREFSSLIDTQQRTTNNKDKSREQWRSYQINRWPTHVQNFIPGLFRIIACLQGFCNPANASGMPFGLRDIGGMVDMGGWDEASGNLNERDSTTKTVKTLIQRLQKNVRIVRDHAYISSVYWLM